MLRRNLLWLMLFTLLTMLMPRDVALSQGSSTGDEQAPQLSTTTVTAQLFQPGRAVVNARSNHWVLDAMPSLAGPDQEVNPLEALLGALAACGMFVYETAAQEMGIPLERVSIAVDADFAPQGVQDGSVDSRFRIFRIMVDMEGPTVEQVSLLDEEFRTRCPVYTTLALAAPIEIIHHPNVVYSTYLGGDGDDGGHANFGVRSLDVAVDHSGNIYVTGHTTSTSGFPGLSAGSLNGPSDAFVTKITASGAVSYTKLLGGSSADGGLGITVDSVGNAYVVGATQSADFPTPNGFDTCYGTLDGNNQCVPSESDLYFAGDAFIAKLDPDGVLLAATYLGDSKADQANAIALDSQGHVFVTGRIRGPHDDDYAHILTPDFDGFDTTHGISGTLPSEPHNDLFIAKLDPNLENLEAFTYIGGNSDNHGLGLTIDELGDVYVTGGSWQIDRPWPYEDHPFRLYGLQERGVGQDVLVVKLDNTLDNPSYFTILSGRDADVGYAIAVDSDGNAYVTGLNHQFEPDSTLPNGFPATTRFQSTEHPRRAEAFVSKLDPNGEHVYSTVFGGTDRDIGTDIAVDDQGNAYVTGHASHGFSVTSRAAIFPPFHACAEDISLVTEEDFDPNHDRAYAFLIVLNPTGSELLFSTCLGGTSINARNRGWALAREANGHIYVAGNTWTGNFPVLSTLLHPPLQPIHGGGADVFVTVIDGSRIPTEPGD